MPPDATKHRRHLLRLFDFCPGAAVAGITLAAVLELLYRWR